MLQTLSYISQLHHCYEVNTITLLNPVIDINVDSITTAWITGSQQSNYLTIISWVARVIEHVLVCWSSPHSYHVTFSKWVDTLICHTTKRRNGFFKSRSRDPLMCGSSSGGRFLEMLFHERTWSIYRDSSPLTFFKVGLARDWRDLDFQ